MAKQIGSYDFKSAKLARDSIEVGGRNYARTNVDSGTSVVHNGVTFTVIGPSAIKINGTATASGVGNTTWFGGLTLEPGDYMLWLTNTNGGTIWFRLGTGSSNTHVYSTNGNHTRDNPYRFTVTTAATYQFGPVCAAGTFSNVETKFMLEKGTIPTEWSKAEEDVDAAIADGKIWYAECPTAADAVAKVATITPATTAFELKRGVMVNVYFSATNTGAIGSLTLNVNGSGAKPLRNYYNGGVSTLSSAGYLKAGSIITFRYDGTNWLSDLTVNSTYNMAQVLWNQPVIASSDTYVGTHIIIGDSGGYRNLAAGKTFDLGYPILYYATAASTTIASGSTANNHYLSINGVTFTTNGTITSGAANKTLYLKGTISGNVFTVAAAPFMTCTPPTSQDGYIYIPLGVMSSATAGRFTSSKDLYAYVDGAFRQVNPTDIVATQKVYYRSHVGGDVPVPTAWIEKNTDQYNTTVSGGNAGWSTKVTPIASALNPTEAQKHLYLYTCEQRKRLDGTVKCTGRVSGSNTYALLDDSNTVIDGGKIITGSVTANQIAAGAVTAGKIAAGAITAGKISIGDYNNYITANENYPDTLEGGIVSDGWIYKNNATGSNIWLSPSLPNWTKEGEKYRVTGVVKVPAAGTFAIIIYGRNADGTAISSSSTGHKTLSANTETAIDYEITINSSTASEPKSNVAIVFCTTAGTTSYQTGYCKQMRLERMTGGELIVDGAITADKIAANAITIGMIPDANRSTLSSTVVKLTDIASYTASGEVTGPLVITTPITTPYMVQMHLKGYNYAYGSETIDLEIGFYNYTANFYNHGYVNHGSMKLTPIKLAKVSSSDKRAMVIIGDATTSWSYPKIVIEEALITHTAAPDSYMSGWSMTIPSTYPTSLIELTQVNNGNFFKGDISEAKMTATNYITADPTDGIKVHNAGDSTTFVQIVSGAIDFVRSSVSAMKMWLDGTVAKVRVGIESAGHSIFSPDGMEVFTDATTSVAKFGSEARIGEENTSHIKLDTTGVGIHSPTGALVSKFGYGTTQTTSTSTGTKPYFVVAEPYSDSSTTVWSSSESYAEGRVVSYNGTQYVCTTSNTNKVPSGTSSYWALLYGSYSFASGNKVIASGPNSHAEGVYTKALGSDSHAEGNSTMATMSYSHSEGVGTLANHYGAHAEGGYTKAQGQYSHAAGYHTVAQHYQTVIGKYNDPDASGSPKYAFIIGNGTADDDLSNAFMVDWNGAVEANGVHLIGTNVPSTSSYPGFVFSDGTSAQYIRTTTNGILPVSADSTNGKSSIGTSTWPFANGYFKKINGVTPVLTDTHGSLSNETITVTSSSFNVSANGTASVTMTAPSKSGYEVTGIRSWVTNNNDKLGVVAASVTSFRVRNFTSSAVSSATLTVTYWCAKVS